MVEENKSTKTINEKILNIIRGCILSSYIDKIFPLIYSQFLNELIIVALIKLSQKILLYKTTF